MEANNLMFSNGILYESEAIPKNIIINNRTTTAYDFIQRVVCCADY